MTQPVTIHARPHLNGNTPEDFQAAGRKLVEAVDAFEKALNEATRETLHGRNYQHLHGQHGTISPQAARAIDILKVNHIRQWMEEAKVFGVALYDNGRKQ